MSPIIYTRHHCNPAEDSEVAAMSCNESEGAMWQCPDCQSYWETNVRKASDGQVLSFVWECIGRPKEMAILRQVEKSLTAQHPEP